MWDILLFLILLGAAIAFAKAKHWKLIVALFVIYSGFAVVAGVLIGISNNLH